ncbi:hypothetical protein [Prosthecobacter sp.]|uniref:hypothetical protein n=1 Tax=Prosthecobacter sp. TaxID=1965333 RepID=UPI002AB8328D|nr:hypothetical protein [Prosthecobacter sp.]MDZ4402383.1 hypothetical protein [Prosthecobacter sp.]
MSQSDQPQKAGATFLWVLGAFAGFAVLFTIIQAVNDSKQGFDPRESERTAYTAEILKAQSDNLAKLGLTDAAKKKSVFEKTLADLGAKKPAVSTQVVPGSPTQLKQAAAAMPAAAVPAPVSPAPAAGTPPTAPAAPVPVPAAAPAPITPASPAPAVPAVPAPAPAAPAPPK